MITTKQNSWTKKQFDKGESSDRSGKVFITGFGPGDPDLLTVKALRILQLADVIYYDDLINHEYLENFNAEKVYVGKRKGNHRFSQDQINHLLYQSARAGKLVIRLKGGDPFVFGRGGEELQYLKNRSIDVEVIPGITAAFGAAASIGISLTQREISSSVAFCTGYPKHGRKIPNADTLVFYMSASNLNEVAMALIKSGRKIETPVVLVRNATLASQETTYTSLSAISKGQVSLASPMVAIIGEVAKKEHISEIETVLKNSTCVFEPETSSISVF